MDPYIVRLVVLEVLPRSKVVLQEKVELLDVYWCRLISALEVVHHLKINESILIFLN